MKPTMRKKAFLASSTSISADRRRGPRLIPRVAAVPTAGEPEPGSLAMDISSAYSPPRSTGRRSGRRRRRRVPPVRDLSWTEYVSQGPFGQKSLDPERTVVSPAGQAGRILTYGG